MRCQLLSFAIVTCLLVAAPTAKAESPREVSAAIDASITAPWAEKGITPAPRALDADLVRRLYLDLLGRIPTLPETREYLSDAAPDKHHQLIDALLIHPEGPVHWRGVLHGWLNESLLEEGNSQGFLEFLEHNLAKNRPWNELARELLLPNLDDSIGGNASYFLAARLSGPDKATRIDNMTTAVASVLFGVQMQCAKCHDHPFVSDWKQDHYYGLAAMLSRLETAKRNNANVLKERADGEVSFVTTKKEEKTAQAMFLDGHVFEDPPRAADKSEWYLKGESGKPDVPKYSRVAALADYALRSDSEYFKRAMTNRMWKQLMGRGLVEPVDQMHAANPATHPDVLLRLSEDFASNGFDLRRLMAVILHSDAYLRSSRWPEGARRPSDSDYALAILKPLSPEQLATSVGVASGSFDLFQAKHEAEKKNRKLDEVTPAIARARYARERELQDFAARFRNRGEAFEANAGQALFLSYNALVLKQLKPGPANLVQRLSKQADVKVVVAEAYLTVLSREPGKEELAEGTAFLTPHKSEACAELVWALLCSAEFRFCH